MTGGLLTVLAVAAGAFLGGALRWELSRLIPGPGGTFAANMVGAASIGLALGFFRLTGVPEAALPYAFFVTGFAGGLSTWSTLAKELGGMLRARQYWRCARYAFFTLALGLVLAARGMVWAGRIYHGL